MKKITPYNKGRNKSTSTLSPVILKSLQNIFRGEPGSVTYVFQHPRIKFTEEEPKGVQYNELSMLNTKIQPSIIMKESRGKLYKRTAQEVLEVFEDTKNDLGAAYFILG